MTKGKVKGGWHPRITEGQHEERRLALETASTVQEAADLCDISRPAMNSHLNRCMPHLREKFYPLSLKGSEGGGQLSGVVVTANDITDRLIERAQQTADLEKMLNGANAKIAQLEGLLVSEREARQRLEETKRGDILARVEAALATPGEGSLNT